MTALNTPVLYAKFSMRILESMILRLSDFFQKRSGDYLS